MKKHRILELKNAELSKKLNEHKYIDDETLRYWKKNVNTYHEGFNSSEDAIEYLDEFLQHTETLPTVLTLYRLLQVNSEKDIDKNSLGIHYTNDKNVLYSSDFIEDLGWTWDTIENEPFYIITIQTNTSNIDWSYTINTRLSHPQEEEYTLNENSNYKIIKIEKLDKKKIRD